MKLTSATIHKTIKKLQDEKAHILSQEEKSEVYMSTVGYEDTIPDYNYSVVREKVDVIDLKIAKLKHAINVMNCTTTLPESDLTLDAALITMAQLEKKKAKLDTMRKRIPKERYVDHGYGTSSNLVQYQCINYDLEQVEADYQKVFDEILKIQCGIDFINQTTEIEVDI